MNRVLSTHVCVNHRLTVAWLNRALQAGIPAVEIFCARQHLDYRDRGQITELGHWFRDARLKVHSLHSPMYTDDVWGKTGPNAVINICETSKPKRIQMTDEIKRALEVAESIPFRYLIQHIGVLAEIGLDLTSFSAVEPACHIPGQQHLDLFVFNVVRHGQPRSIPACLSKSARRLRA
jgi:hypothetical protein